MNSKFCNIYSHFTELEHMSIRQLATELSFSTATILRFCKKINLSGYSELKHLITKNNYKANESSVLEFNSTHEVHEFIQDIENPLLLIRDESIKDIIEAFDSNKSIHPLLRWEISACVTDYFEKILFSFGRQEVYCYESPKLATDVSQSFSDQNILFVVIASGMTTTTLQLANMASMRATKIIRISPYKKKKLATLAEINFRFMDNARNNKNAE